LDAVFSKYGVPIHGRHVIWDFARDKYPIAGSVFDAIYCHITFDYVTKNWFFVSVCSYRYARFDFGDNTHFIPREISRYHLFRYSVRKLLYR